MLRGILFDMDGTLFDTERLALWAWRQAAEDLGIPYREEPFLRIKGMSGEGIRKCIQAFLEHPEDFDALNEGHNRYIRESLQRDGVPGKPGVPEALRALREMGLLLAVASSSPRWRVDACLRGSGTAAFFQAAVSGDMVSRGKPAPDIFLKAAALLSLPPADCLVVEDTPTGVLAAHRAGMQSVVIPDLVPPTPETLRLALMELPSAAELPDLVRRLLQEPT